MAVVILTVIDRGATRAYSTPWIFLFWFAQVAPILALVLRASPGARPLLLPSRSWMVLFSVFATTVLLSSWLSPFRGSSLLAALTPLAAVAAFILIHDAARHDRERFIALGLRWITVAALTILGIGLGRWGVLLVQTEAYKSVTGLLAVRNEFPLGHSNYTAGLALFITPWFGWLAWRNFGLTRWIWVGVTLAGLTLLFSSGSRGGLMGAAALGVLAVLNARVKRRILALLIVLAVTTTLALGYAHPRTRAMVFARSSTVQEPNASNVQRSAMALAGWQMGRDRPLLGWGTGTTALVYPRYRSGLDGGVETALQLHSTPVQLWADLGLAGIACSLGFLGFVWFARPVRSNFRTRLGGSVQRESDRGAAINATDAHPFRSPVFVGLLSYAVFALTDYQLDVPVFALAVAVCAALLARPAVAPVSRRGQLGVAASAVAVLVVMGIWGHRDSTPEMNVRALEIGRDAARNAEAVALLKESLRLNPDQEIAHFNLGWLQVVRDPVAAEKHFLAAAHLVPDKGGVYFGVALARLNQDRPELQPAVVRALALEALNDPRFLISPWWRQPNLRPLRADTLVELNALANTVALRLAAQKDRRSREADYIAVLGEWLDDRGQPGEILRRSYTSGRVSFFAARPPVPEWQTAPVRAYHRERAGYPVLMRNLDIPPPVDLFDVQENSLASTELAPLFAPKGWLPAPLLIELLDSR